MIRIKPNRCGYSNWSCQGIPQLSSFMFNGHDATVSAMDAEIFKLPVKIKGMVYTEDTINMGWQRGGPHPEIPELTCRKDTDPDSDSQDPSVHKNYILVDVNDSTYQYPVYGGTGGWLDLFNAGYDVSGSTQYFYHDLPVPGSTVQAAAVTDVYLTVDGSTTRNQIYDIDNIPSFQRVEGTTVTELEMGPGLLEPMLDTSFDPIGIDTIPAWEAGDDSFIFEAAVLNAWKGVVDDRIRNIYARINNIRPGTTDTKLRELKNEEYRKAECDNFPITLDAGGSALRTYAEVSASDSNVNTYTIGSGNVLVNGVEYTVEPVTGVTAPFYAYLNASAEYTSVFSSDTLPETVSSGAMYVSGGTVTEIVSAAYPDYLWKWTVLYPWKTGASVEIRVVPSQPLPDVGRAGIGGVNVISGGTNADDFVLFKTFREDCIVSADLGPDDGLVNHIYPQENPPPDGPEYEAGPVFPYDNIMSGTTGTERTDWGHSAYVPTVNATYEFVHNDTYGYGDDMAATQALAHRYVTSGAETSILTYNYTQDDIPFKAIDNDMSAGLADLVADAQARVDETSAAYVADPTEENLSAYNDAQAARDAAVTSSGLYANAAVVGGTPGTVFVVSAMIASGGSMLTPTPAEAAVPTLDAVDLYVHGHYSLAQWGSVVRPSYGSSYVDHGYPGTVLTVDEIDDPLYSAGEYYYDDIPTVRAVVKYVKEHQTSATDAESGLLVISGTEEAFDEDHMPVRGTVEVADNILVGGTPTLTTQVVPSVHAVHTFVTTYDAVVGSVYLDEYEPEVPEVIGGTTGIVKPVGNIESGTVDNSALDSVVPTALAVVNYVATKAGLAVPGEMALDAYLHYEESLTGNTTGVVNVARNIVVSPLEDFRDRSIKTVPTLEAVYNFIHGQTVYAVSTGGTLSLETANSLVTGGTLTPVTATGSTVITAYSPSGTQGTCYMATVIPLGTTVSIGLDNCAPTVDAVISYVSNMLYEATPGTLVEGATTEEWAAGTGYTEPVLGEVYVSTQIVVKGYTAGTAEPTLSTTVVPTIKAVYDFVHNSTTDTAYRALSTWEDMAWDSTNNVFSTPGTPGTCLVVDNIVTVQSSTTESGGSTVTSITVDTQGSTTAQGCVPTAQGVVNYVHAYIEGHTSTAGTITLTTSSGSTAKQESINGHTVGMPMVASNILLGDEDPNAVSPEAVPTVKGVYDFIHYTPHSITGATTADTFSSPMAEITAMTATHPASGGGSITGYTVYSDPGTVLVASDIRIHYVEVAGATTKETAPYCVATAQAVVDYIEGLHLITESDIAIPDGLKTFVVGTTTNETWVHGSSIHAPGIVDVASNILLGQSNNLTVKVVPSVKAVYDFIHSSELDVTGATEAGYGVFHQALAIPGTLTVTYSGSSESGETVSGGTPGTAQVVSNVHLATAPIYHSISKRSVPTVEGIFNFIHNSGYGDKATDTIARALATTGTLGTHQESGTVTGYTSFAGTAGTCQITSVIPQGATASTAILSVECVPNAGAVVDFVDGRIANAITTGVVGTLTVSGDSESIADIGDTTASEGYVWPVQNITMNATAEHRTYSAHTAVPTVEAVIKYIHSITATGIGQDDAKASISASTVTTAGGSTAALVTGATPGTFFVTGDITALGSTVTAWSGSQPVPTALAVATYVRGYTAFVGGFTVSSSDEEAWITNRAATAGIYRVVDTLVAAATVSHRGLSISSVPTVAAVKDYVDTHAAPAVDAVKGTITVNASGAESLIPAEAMAGVVQPVTNIIKGTTATLTESPNDVPTVTAVWDFIHSTSRDASGSTACTQALGTPAAITLTAGVESWSGTPGTVQISTNITGGTESPNKVSPYAVPTVKAVKDYVDPLIISASTAGTLYIPANASTVAWNPAAVAGYVEVSTKVVVGTNTAVTNQVVPSVGAVKDFVSGYTASVGTFTVPATGNEAWGATASTAGIVYVVDTVKAASAQANRVISEKSVPTTYAVKAFVTGYTATVGSFTASASAETWDTGSTASAGIYQVVSNIAMATTDTAVARSISKNSVPTVEAVNKFVTGHTATVGTFTVPASGNEAWSTVSTAGIVQVVDTVQAASTHAARIISEHSVPTTYAVKTYVDSHVSPSSYDGPFAVSYVTGSTTNVEITAGNAHFAGKLYTYSGTTSYSAGSTATTLYVQFVKGSTVGSIVESDTTGATVAAFPIARKAANAGGITQLQYGDINILGRWM